MARIEPRRGGFYVSQVPWLQRFDRRSPWLSMRSYLALKRAFDLGIVLLSLPLTLPLFLVCALAVKLGSPRGPILFAQMRSGAGGRRFRMYKFRTMVPDAEAMKEELRHRNELAWPDFKVSGDPRVNKVGRVLRMTSLDELPQLINVVKNDMSLVGPRPTSFAASTYDLWHTERLTVQPGVTGLWQLVGRGSMSLSDRTRLDIAYIERRCFALDLEILVRTAPAILMRKGRAE